MKGVILGIAPRTTIVDITHQVTPFEITEGAFVVAETYRHFPKGTTHVVVVDPGVGTSRRPLLVQAAGQYFIGPDNGVFSLVYQQEKAKVRVLSNRKFFRKDISQTFHGRDIFAPAAAHLAAGVRPSVMGPVVHDYRQPSGFEPIRTGKHQWNGAILKTDRFGNLITNLRAADFPDVLQRPFSLVVGVTPVERLVKAYAEASPAEPVVIVGSSGYLEVSVNQGNAAKALGCATGSPVELTLF